MRATAATWLAEQRRAFVIEVAAARGSVPRGAGTRMLVATDGAVGTIGGGHLELKAIAFARQLLASGTTEQRERHYPLGPALGQCCGGAVTLAFAPLDDAALARWPIAQPLFHLQLHGAGHVGRAVATLLATLDVEVHWFDQRDDGFPETTLLGSPWPAHIRRTSIDTVEAEVRHAPVGACFLVLTHEHALDLRIVEAILRRGDFAFCGLIGSKTKRASFGRRLAERGVAPESIERLVCPIGIAGIAGKEPEVIAAAVVAQLLLEHRRALRTIGTDASSPAPGDRPAPPLGRSDGARVLAAAGPVRRRPG